MKQKVFNQNFYFAGLFLLAILFFNFATDLKAEAKVDPATLENARQQVKIQEIGKKLRESQPPVDYAASNEDPMTVWEILQGILAIALIALLIVVVCTGILMPYILIRWILGLLGESKRWVAGGIFGSLVGVSVGILFLDLIIGITWSVILCLAFLWIDFKLSKHTAFWRKDLKELYKLLKKDGRGGNFGSGFGGMSGGSSSGGGFGGFGGGKSGGGGSSGSW